MQSRRNGLALGYDPTTGRFVTAYVGDDNVDDANGNNCNDTQSSFQAPRPAVQRGRNMTTILAPAHATFGIAC